MTKNRHGSLTTGPKPWWKCLSKCTHKKKTWGKHPHAFTPCTNSSNVHPSSKTLHSSTSNLHTLVPPHSFTNLHKLTPSCIITGSSQPRILRTTSNLSAFTYPHITSSILTTPKIFSPSPILTLSSILITSSQPYPHNLASSQISVESGVNRFSVQFKTAQISTQTLSTI